jgi:hypothetical protein
MHFYSILLIPVRVHTWLSLPHTPIANRPKPMKLLHRPDGFFAQKHTSQSPHGWVYLILPNRPSMCWIGLMRFSRLLKKKCLAEALTLRYLRDARYSPETTVWNVLLLVLPVPHSALFEQRERFPQDWFKDITNYKLQNYKLNYKLQKVYWPL